MGSSSYVKNLCSSSTQWQPVVMLGFVTHQGDTAGRWQPCCVIDMIQEHHEIRSARRSPKPIAILMLAFHPAVHPGVTWS